MDFLDEIFLIFKSLVRTFSVSDFLDILIVTILIYNLIKIVRESRAGQLVKGIVIILIGYFFACQFHFRMLSTLLSNFFQFSVFGLLVVFQPELRRILEQLGRSKWSLSAINKEEDSYVASCKNVVKITSESVLSLSEERMGALIVFERKTKLGEIIDTGTIIKSEPSVPIICNIFYNKAPLHDGALIIRDNILYAGGCILPLTHNNVISKDLGTRHRAAIGISENSDAVAVVVSEETGKISIAVNGTLTSYLELSDFKNDLEKLLISQSVKEEYKGFFNSFRRVIKND